jgi:Na+-translocating ferredoxin:NAD+ oxidoreductase RnfA subunit
MKFLVLCAVLSACRARRSPSCTDGMRNDVLYLYRTICPVAVMRWVEMSLSHKYYSTIILIWSIAASLIFVLVDDWLVGKHRA